MHRKTSGFSTSLCHMGKQINGNMAGSRMHLFDVQELPPHWQAITRNNHFEKLFQCWISDIALLESNYWGILLPQLRSLSLLVILVDVFIIGTSRIWFGSIQRAVVYVVVDNYLAHTGNSPRFLTVRISGHYIWDILCHFWWYRACILDGYRFRVLELNITIFYWPTPFFADIIVNIFITGTFIRISHGVSGFLMSVGNMCASIWTRMIIHGTLACYGCYINSETWVDGFTLKSSRGWRYLAWRPNPITGRMCCWRLIHAEIDCYQASLRTRKKWLKLCKRYFLTTVLLFWFWFTLFNVVQSISQEELK